MALTVYTTADGKQFAAADGTLLAVRGGLGLIFDRTPLDFARAKTLLSKSWASMSEEDKAEWATALKGAYNAEDINRVNNAVKELAQKALDLLNAIKAYRDSKQVASDQAIALPYTAADVSVNVSEWVYSDIDIPTKAEMETYLQNVATIRSLINIESGNPALPKSMEKLTIDGANAIEKSLDAAYSAQIQTEATIKEKIDRMATAWYFSGEIYAGEVS